MMQEPYEMTREQRINSLQESWGPLVVRDQSNYFASMAETIDNLVDEFINSLSKGK